MDRRTARVTRKLAISQQSRLRRVRSALPTTTTRLTTPFRMKLVAQQALTFRTQLSRNSSKSHRRAQIK